MPYTPIMPSRAARSSVLYAAPAARHYPKADRTNLILLCSKSYPEKFANFELRYSYRYITKTGNSGVQIRGKIDRPKMFHVGGYQMDNDPANRYTGIIYDEGGVAGKRGIISKRGFKTVYDEKGERTNTPLDTSDAEIKKVIKPVGE